MLKILIQTLNNMNKQFDDVNSKLMILNNQISEMKADNSKMLKMK